MDLQTFFKENNKVAIACSGGVDSTFLLYQAKLWAKDVTAYIVKSSFQPEFELEDARRFCDKTGVRLKVINVQVLNNEEIVSNPENRCYYCKKEIFMAIRTAALNDGYELLLEGTNASDDINDRPGIKALLEYGVRSPLRECGYTKDRIREESREARLPFYGKPAYACLATRIPCGVRITEQLLYKVEQGENLLFSYGFTDFRIRWYHNAARIQLKEEEMQQFLEKRKEITEALLPYFDEVLLDMKVCR